VNPVLENRVIVPSGVVGYHEDFSSTGIKGSNPTTDKALCPQVSVFCAHSGLEMVSFVWKNLTKYIQSACNFITNSELGYNTGQIHEFRR
jgi:hypothetical protein